MVTLTLTLAGRGRGQTPLLQVLLAGQVLRCTRSDRQVRALFHTSLIEFEHLGLWFRHHII